MTGATGELVPDSTDAEFAPGERREVEDAVHHADMTHAQGRTAPAQQGSTGDPGRSLPTGGPTNMASRDAGYGSEHGLSPDDPAYRMESHPEPSADGESAAEREPRIGGDEFSDHEPRF